jgi:hypothetical protein
MEKRLDGTIGHVYILTILEIVHTRSKVAQGNYSLSSFKYEKHFMK